ncbi:Small subunit processome component 20 [Pleurostoma richardsiae]|uniref:Small subunit processome component 20 n=1 Tax=Pleurostoma richardsiae TaxID=41990 RepID=A0AA38VLB3_9PEZI|nr:Small subunit processome component 20 [Pleurostoma richardsiae]
MASKSSGRVIKPRKPKNLTPHQRNHRWESFSTKISKLHSLDPLRKVRRHDLDAEDLSATTSYFRNGLEKWADLNISKPFTSFRREVSPLCETLAQILHFERKIMDLLATYISMQDKEALEPLLDLLTAFAHDLGVRFEKHYQRSLELLTAIAAKPQDAGVVEWTFAALAFLFKYLARLLVPDLRPTYNMLAGLMGKQRHPQHIGRFAAEAMSFLIKKSAAPSSRETALPLIVKHAQIDLASSVGTKQFELYQHGMMTMFLEAMQSSGHMLHSTAPDVFSTLLKATPDDEFIPGNQRPWSDLCCGVLTGAIHHSTPETFQSLGESIITQAAAPSTENSWRWSLFVRIFGIIAGVRKGSRVTDWPALVKALSTSLEFLLKSPRESSEQASSVTWEDVMINTAIVWNEAPMDAIIPSIPDLMRILTKEPFMRWYIPFCAYFAELNPRRFQSLFQKHFQKFIVSHWSDGDNEEMLCVLLPRMVDSGALPPGGQKDSCPLPQSWQDQIVSKFERLEITPFPERGAYDKDPKTWRDKCLPKYSSLLEVLGATAVHPSTTARIAELLLRKLKLALRPSTSLATEEANFIVSQGLRSYLQMAKASGSIEMSLSPLLKAAAPRFSRNTAFLESFLEYEREMASRGGLQRQRSAGSESPVATEDPLVKSLMDNLATSSHALRLASLKVLDLLDMTPDQQSCLATMIQIEEIPLGHQSPRVIAVHLRKLGLSYGHLDEMSWLSQAIPKFLFGMMTIRLAPVWDESIEIMKQIAQNKTGEEVIATLAFQWLDVPSPQWGRPEKPAAGANGNFITEFECRDFRALQEAAEGTRDVVENSENILLQMFERAQETVPANPDDARSKALKVLSALPAIAEKRSRKLVPYLLSLTEAGSTTTEEDEEDDESPPEEKWFMVDKKALVAVFAQFGNPKVLYQSQKAYEALLSLLANRDLELQKLALKAILTWKQEGVKTYQENLEYLLDEARFKNELTVFFQSEQKVQPEHRAELMPVLLRLLYGRATSKKGAASGRHGLHATRLAIIRNLSLEDMGQFLDICLGELRDVRVVDSSGLREDIFSGELISPRKQVGVLNMVESILNELGVSVEQYAEPLVNAVLYCLMSASRSLREITETGDEWDQDQDHSSNTSLNRVVRTTALKSLCTLFKNAQSFDWTPYQGAIVSEVISPRIEKLPAETTQGISATCRLLETWSLLPKSALLLSVDKRIVPKVIEILEVEKSKDEIKVFSLSIIRNLVHLALAPASESEFNELIKAALLDSNIDLVLSAIGGLLRGDREISRNLLEACVETVVELSPLVKKSDNASSLVDISTYMLNQPSRRVNPKVKGYILLILEHFIVLEDLQSDVELKLKVYNTLASLFSFFKDKQNRQALSRVLLVFASQEPSVQEVADLCSDLNSYVERRLDEPDYDRRLKAYNKISLTRDAPFTVEQWKPLLHNMVFYLHQDEEFGILSSNSADCLCKFVDAVKSSQDGSSHEAFVGVLSTVVMAAIYSGAREPSETVRREVLRLLGHLVSTLPAWAPVADLAILVPSDDSESDKAFFFNILTPAVSKQVQALQLLSAANERAQFSSKNIAHLFIPLLEHFIFGRDGSDDHGLGAQATTTIASLTGSLEWQQYRAVLRRYIGFVESKPDLQKQVIRLLDKVVDSLAACTVEQGDLMELDSTAPAESKQTRLSKTLPNQEKLGEEVVNNFLPPLMEHLHAKDEETVSARVPVGVIVVKLLKLLPTDVFNGKLPAVLTDISQILRSKAWESREMARGTLAKISCILGPTAFGFVLKELRGALTKGSQLHVLSYTMHTLLLAVIPEFKQGDLDYCLDSIVTIIVDDIFGATGQEKDAEDYATKMKEVKSSKSQDSMELIAKNASIGHLVDLVRPLKALLMEKLDLRIIRKIDELLSRITSGLLQNPSAGENRDVLVFCYEVIQEVYNAEKPREEQRMDPRLRRYLIQKGAKKSGERGTSSKCTYKLTRFALDILRAVMKKHDHLRNAGNLMGFIPILGDAVVGDQDEVKIAAFKLLTVIVKVPFKNSEADGLYKVSVREAIKSISASISTSSDLSQTALKLISVILRDRREVVVKDAAIDVLLGKLKDDLTEPLYRHVTFNFLRCVLDRKIETAVVYDTLDYVGTVMITNDDKGTRDLARGAFFQFLREYPQKRSRWAKQLNFIVANLQYEREGGRLSVMEVIHLLLMKAADDFTQEVAATCFIPLFVVSSNDDSEKCRLAAGELIKEIFRKADKERLQKFLTLLRSWVAEDGKPAVARLALQTFGYYFEARDATAKDKKDVDLCINKVTGVLDNVTESSDPEILATSLQLIQVLFGRFSSAVLSGDADGLWDGVGSCLAHPNSDVKLRAIKLLGTYLADFARNAKGDNAPDQTLLGSHGLELDHEERERLVRLMLNILSGSDVDENLAKEAVRILMFLGSYLDIPAGESDDEEDEDDDEYFKEEAKERMMTVGYIFSRLARVIRKETPPRAATLVPKLAAIDALETFCDRTPREGIELSLKTILRPLRNLTDPSIATPFSGDELFKTRYEELKAKAQSVMELLQKKLGAADYTKHLLAVGEEIRDRRQQRLSKRKVEAVTQPEKYGREKRKKLEKKKERRKTKGSEHRSMRRGY